MTQHQSDAIEAALADLEADEKAMLSRAADMMQTDDGAVYGFDFWAYGAVKRALALSAGFRTLIHDRNLICAGALLRLQLDTALRFFAGFIVEKPHDFAIAILNGKRVDKMKDRDGKYMTDRYLLTQLTEEYPWIESVYEKTSGYIHMSGTHMFSTFQDVNKENRSVGIKIGQQDNDLPDSVYLETIDAFRESTKIFARYIDGWIFTRANPETVAKMKAARD